MLDRMASSQARSGLENQRETKDFSIRNRAGKWSITTVQMGNNFAHTLRDGSQENGEINHEDTDICAEDTGMAASPSKMTWARGVTWI